MALPADFDADKWLDPIAFEGLVGRVLASPEARYRDLFRPDGFAKPIDELNAVPQLARLLCG